MKKLSRAERKRTRIIREAVIQAQADTSGGVVYIPNSFIDFEMRHLNMHQIRRAIEFFDKNPPSFAKDDSPSHNPAA